MKLLITAWIALMLAAGHSAQPVRACAEPQPVTMETVGRAVQVFDVAQGKVVVFLPNTEELQQEVRGWIGAIEGLSKEARAQPKDGLVIRVELSEPASLKPEVSAEQATELFLFLRANRRAPAQMLLFTKKGQPLLVETGAELTPFINKHGLKDYFKKSPSNRRIGSAPASPAG